MAGQWTSPDAHLAYVSDAAGNEEAFHILSNTTDTITIQAEFDLLDSARNIATSAPVAIRRAHTVGGLLGVGEETGFTTDDNVYLWNGASWTIYWYNANNTWGSPRPSSPEGAT